MKIKILIIICLAFLFSSLLQAQNEDPGHKFKIGVYGGLGIRTASFNETVNEMVSSGVNRADAKDFLSQQRWTNNLNVETYYLFRSKSNTMGLGVKYIFATTSAEANGLNLNNGDGVSVFRIDMLQNHYFNFIAPSFYTESFLNSKRNLKAVASLSIGYLNYRVEEKTDIINSVTTGNTFGVNTELGLEYFIKKNWAIGANVSYFAANLGNMKIKTALDSYDVDFPSNQRIGLGRFDFMIGVKFYK